MSSPSSCGSGIVRAVPPAPKVKILVPEVSAAMKVATDEAAREQNVSRNEWIGSTIAARYGLKYVTTGAEYRPGADLTEGPWSVDLPENVRRKLRVEAARRGGTISGLVRETLAEKLGLPVESVKRRPRSR